MQFRSAIVLPVLAAASVSAEPISDSLSFSRLATLEHIGRIDVNPQTGEIAVGATGPGFGSAQHVRVVGTDGSVRTVGAAVPDPDSVIWDMGGLFADPGSVLVGGVGGLFSVAPTGSTSLLFEAGLDFVNPEDMAFSTANELLIADYNVGRVQSLDTQGRFATVAVSASAVNQVAVSTKTGEILFGDQAGIASGADESGRLLSAGPNSFITGLAFGDGSALWGDDAYGVDRTTGELLRFRDSGFEVIAQGLFAGFDPGNATRMPDAAIDFLPTGEMVVAVPTTDTIWTVVPPPASSALFALGGLTAMRRRR